MAPDIREERLTEERREESYTGRRNEIQQEIRKSECSCTRWIQSFKRRNWDTCWRGHGDGGTEEPRRNKVQVHLSGVSRKGPTGYGWKVVLADLGSCCCCLLAWIHRFVVVEFLWFCNFLEQSSLDLEHKLKRKWWQWEWSLIEDLNARISQGQQKSGLEEWMKPSTMGPGWMNAQVGLGMLWWWRGEGECLKDCSMAEWQAIWVWGSGRGDWQGSCCQNTNVWVSDNSDMLSSRVWCSWWYA